MLMHCVFGGGIRGMGERVTQSGSAREDLARASRLKEALDSGASPAFVPPSQPGNGSHPDNVSLSDSQLPSNESKQASNVRLQFFDQMFQAYPDGLSIADSDHRILWANEKFSQMFGYPASEIVGQQLESLIVPAERLAESHWVTEALGVANESPWRRNAGRRTATWSTFLSRALRFDCKKNSTAFTPGIMTFQIANAWRR